MHSHHTVAAAVGQRLPVHLGQLCRRRSSRRGSTVFVDIVRNLVYTVAQIGAVEQNVQWDFTYPPLSAQLGQEGVPTNR